MVRVGFIGLGSQGGPMARRVVEDGYPLTVWGRHPETTGPFADAGATVVATPAQVGAASDIVGICVTADADVQDVLVRPDGVLAGLAPGGIVAIHSTIHPDTCRRLADTAAAYGVTVIDAPVSGGGQAAAEQRLLVMAGGDEAAVDRCRPVFATFAHLVIQLGPVGSGQSAKILNNLVFTAQIAVGLATFAIADVVNVDRAALAEVLAHGSGGSRAAAILAHTHFDTTGLRQHTPLLRKDIDLAVDLTGAHARAAGTGDSFVLFGLAETAFRLLEASS